MSEKSDKLIWQLLNIRCTGRSCKWFSLQGTPFYVIGNSVGIAYYIKSLTEQERTAAEG